LHVHTHHRHPSTAVVVLTVMLAVATVSAGVKIRTKKDDSFNFRGLRTWAWHPEGAGTVKMALTENDKPDELQRQFEPTIIEAVTSELGQRGWTPSTQGTPDLEVHYYLLISTNLSSQSMGQFVPATMEWGLPPFSGQTTAFKMIEQGSLVLDVSAPSLKSVVWRGVAETEIDRERNQEQRRTRVREAIRDMLRKLPANR
jgi:uncharacterized protein DUF4136